MVRHPEKTRAILETGMLVSKKMLCARGECMFSRRCARLHAGFTLIELLVVLLIVSIVTAVAIMAFGDFGARRREKVILEQFAATISAVQRQAIFTPIVMGLAITDDGYRYYHFVPKTNGDGVWRVGHSFALTQETAFKHIFKLKVNDIAAYDAGHLNGAPSILFLPSGYVTPFKITFVGKSNTFTMDVKNNGQSVIQDDTKS